MVSRWGRYRDVTVKCVQGDMPLYRDVEILFSFLACFLFPSPSSLVSHLSLDLHPLVLLLPVFCLGWLWFRWPCIRT